ncbi:MAG: tetratricopeptide repeat protein [Candidatus Adiutrix sp.]
MLSLMLLVIAITVYPQKAGAQIKPGQDFLEALAWEYAPLGAADYEKAASLYEKSAAGGFKGAFLALARLYAPHGPLWAGEETWFRHLLGAAMAADSEAAFELACALEAGTIVKEGFEASDFLKQAASLGHGEAALKLGKQYLDGLGADADEKTGAMWLAVAANYNQPEAALILGRFYFETNPKEALRWLEEAQGAEANYLAGEMYLKQRRFIEAIGALTVAAEALHPRASLVLGQLNFENDFGRRPNLREALRLFKVAAQGGDVDGFYRLGHMYIGGHATPKDVLTGAFWLYQAAERGHEAAENEYNKLIYNFTIGQKKRLERMIEEGKTPSSQIMPMGN